MTQPDGYRALHLADVLNEAAILDRVWTTNPAGHDDERSTPWMPFEVYAFIALVAEALPEIQGTRFLEIGCGIGTRMKVAQEFFGLDVHGIDRVPEYIAQAKTLGLSADEADAMQWAGFGLYDLIWFNRPFNDAHLQSALEDRVWREMRSGGVVICANLLDKPPDSWYLILDDWEVRRGIWAKP